jgi:hypothetical protein
MSYLHHRPTQVGLVRQCCIPQGPLAGQVDGVEGQEKARPFCNHSVLEGTSVISFIILLVRT